MAYTPDQLQVMDAIIKRYPRSRSAIMPLLHLYPDQVRRNGFWGGNVELGILSRILGVQIIVHRANRNIDPPINNTNNLVAREVHILYDDTHYDLLRMNVVPVVAAPAVSIGLMHAMTL